MNTEAEKSPKRVGYVTLIGRPNVGKSTLLNALLGEKVSIVTPKAQTTQRAILGVCTRPNAQLLFLDTPGVHPDAGRPVLHKRINRVAWSHVADADLVVWVTEAHRLVDADRRLAERWQRMELTVPLIVVLNKIDKLQNKQALLPILRDRAEEFPFVRAWVPVAAEKKEGLEELVKAIVPFLPEQEDFYYAPDCVTVQSLPFRFAECVREKLMRILGEELPYVVAVEARLRAPQPDSKMPVWDATIWVERETQKRMVIGVQGRILKQVGIAARRDMELVLGQQIVLHTWVKIREGWRNDREFLSQLGFDKPEES